ncbi:MAG: amidase family protein, partial [Flammeovirgaceae bacterium]
CIKNSGMIPFVKTNLPQLALTYDSNNFVWGNTLNSWNKNKSAGGSSGGEGAAIGARISPIGVGNDMLGSVRIPATFNGVVGLLSSPGRLPVMGSTTYY